MTTQTFDGNAGRETNQIPREPADNPPGRSHVVPTWGTLDNRFQKVIVKALRGREGCEVGRDGGENAGEAVGEDDDGVNPNVEERVGSEEGEK